MTDSLSRAGRVHVRLLKPHTHAGRPLQAGDELEVMSPVAEWLRRQAIAEPIPKAAARAAAAESRKND
jgi:hypothetical protein